MNYQPALDQVSCCTTSAIHFELQLNCNEAMIPSFDSIYKGNKCYLFLITFDLVYLLNKLIHVTCLSFEAESTSSLLSLFFLIQLEISKGIFVILQHGWHISIVQSL